MRVIWCNSVHSINGTPRPMSLRNNHSARRYAYSGSRLISLPEVTRLDVSLQRSRPGLNGLAVLPVRAGFDIQREARK